VNRFNGHLTGMNADERRYGKTFFGDLNKERIISSFDFICVYLRSSQLNGVLACDLKVVF
jgi:hypothetical protein